MLDFSREYASMREEILAAMTAVCDAQQFILGPAVTRFEAAAALACEVPFAAGCSSGTEALWLAMAALRIGPGQAVVTTPFSFFATASSILRAGARPLFADIESDTFNLSPTSVAEQLAAHSGPERIAAVLPVHLYGQCADMERLAKLASAHPLHLIEDAAQAFGSSWNGVRAGGLGDIAAFSFYPTKNLSAFGDAGLVTTRSDAVDERLRMLRAHGMRQRYLHEEVGWNGRLDSLQAAVLEVKLRYLEAGNARRRELALLYNKAFTSADLVGPVAEGGVVLPFVAPQAEHVFHQYVLRTPSRDALRAFLTAHGIGSEVYYPLPLHMQPALQYLGYQAGEFPVSEQAAREVLALPIYPELRDDEVDTVVEAIRRFLRTQAA